MSQPWPARGVYDPSDVFRRRYLERCLATPEPERDRSAAGDREIGRGARVCSTAPGPGDQAAFGRLIDLHQRVVFRTALAALGRREDAEDAAQEAFLQAWRNLAGLSRRRRVSHLAADHRLAQGARPSASRACSGGSAPRWPLTIAIRSRTSPETAPDPEREAARPRHRAARAREIARLSPTLRDTLLLAASGEYTYDEIAAMLGTPLGTIKWRVSEARRIVASRMDA